jgi:integrase
MSAVTANGVRGAPVEMDDELRALLAAVQRKLAEAPTVESPPFSTLWKSWRAAHMTLASMGTEDGRAALLLAWKPEEGPFAGIPLGERDPNMMSASDVDLYRVERMKSETRRKRPPKVATVNREIMLWQRILNFAVSRRTINRNPIKGVKLEPENNIRAVVVTEEGIDRILDCLDSPIIKTWTILAFESGMRRGEMLKLCWRQLDADAGVIHIPAAHTKAKRPRDVEFPARSQAAIETLPRVLGCDRVFANPETRQAYDGRWIHELFVRGVTASGVTGVDGKPPRLHDLRRSAITLMRKRGVQESVVMAFSGHADPKVFKRYNIVEQDDLDAAMRKNAAGRATELADLHAKRKGPQRSHSLEKKKTNE